MEISSLSLTIIAWDGSKVRAGPSLPSTTRKEENWRALCTTSNREEQAIRPSRDPTSKRAV
jgi:hypothetical protein